MDFPSVVNNHCIMFSIIDDFVKWKVEAMSMQVKVEFSLVICSINAGGLSCKLQLLFMVDRYRSFVLELFVLCLAPPQAEVLDPTPDAPFTCHAILCLYYIHCLLVYR